ncbi:unnamed protein product [Lactuca virosa]|uniref:Uncharacterized protein n=1 Tax=Lactuca virosa TaxID=75947 RepID=A0AAU9PES7_9ASTR|nr:unnamed protein product [Lactuca virosa]
MEMLEERHKPKIAPKRIKLQEIIEKEEEDRISTLTDCLLLEILSRLPSTKYTIRTVEANLDYTKLGDWETTHSETEEEMLKGFILNLHHVKELKIGSCCSKVVSRLEAKGFVVPPNIKFPDVTYDCSESGSGSGSDTDTDTDTDENSVESGDW